MLTTTMSQIMGRSAAANSVNTRPHAYPGLEKHIVSDSSQLLLKAKVVVQPFTSAFIIEAAGRATWDKK